MQKKMFALLLALAMVLSLAACGQSVGETAPAAEAGSAAAASAAEGSAEAPAEGALKVGFVYIGDASEAYTANFIMAEDAIKAEFGDKVECIAKYNVAEDAVEDPVRELCEAGCGIIFTTSFGYGATVKEMAQQYPDIQFCQATCADADETVANYHNYMGHIYQGRYVAGIVAGLKLQEMIDNGTVAADQAKIGYVAAFDYAEVISGYTAFLMGVRSVVPDVTMDVQYAGSWGDYDTEKTIATALIEDGCCIISQHSDTTGPAEACEDAKAKGTEVYCVSYNQDMTDVAPNTCLISSRQDYAPYEVAAVQAVLGGKGDTIAVDEGAGFEKGWVAMTELNTAIAAEGTQEKIDEAVEAFKSGSLKATDVFKGPYTATNPYSNETIDLNDGFAENAETSAPAFGYVINEIINIKGN
ncbi:MAG: BMP family ABC transporter substrate-binding protein [Oscillospiraceae bacterium]|nr:BMP family ABC transporter substrate-binding protein [Oscillospiraceae bacterium]